MLNTKIDLGNEINAYVHSISFIRDGLVVFEKIMGQVTVRF